MVVEVSSEPDVTLTQKMETAGLVSHPSPNANPSNCHLRSSSPAITGDVSRMSSYFCVVFGFRVSSKIWCIQSCCFSTSLLLLGPNKDCECF